MGVSSYVAESDVKTDWLSSIKETTTDDVVRLVVFWDSRVVHAVVIVSMAFQLFSLLSMRPWLKMVA